jgi:hypothetical protein
MRAPQVSSLFHAAHARLDRLQARLPSAAERELAPSLEAIAAAIDELLVLGAGGGSIPSRSLRTVQSCIERLSEHCAVLEDVLEAEGTTVAVQRALTAVLGACADLATWAMEMPLAAPAQVA